MVRGAPAVGRRMGCSRDVYGAAGWMWDLLGSRASVCDEGEGAVEEVLGAGVQRVEDGVWEGCGQVPEEDFGWDG